MAAAISAGESLTVCVGRLLEVVPVSKADVRKAPPPPFRGSSSKHTHASAHARTRKEQTHVLARCLGRLPINNRRDLCRAVSWYWWVSFLTRWNALKLDMWNNEKFYSDKLYNGYSLNGQIYGVCICNRNPYSQ